MKTCLRLLSIYALACLFALPVGAQNDSMPSSGLDSFMLRQKGIIGDLMKGLRGSSGNTAPGVRIQRNDQAFQSYRGKVIRNILVQSLDFGVPITDTGKRFANTITRILDETHKTTRQRVIRHNLFFSEGAPLSPFMLGATERHLRDLSYLQEAKVVVVPVRGTADSVDVIVFSKDGFSLGGGANFLEVDRFELKIQEDNFLGRGDRIQASGFYDSRRRHQVGWGSEYIMRNISGSFVDVYAGFNSYGRSFTSSKFDEQVSYAKLQKPLVNPYMKWTYALEWSRRESANHYFADSVYKAEHFYRYRLADAWAGWNITADKPTVNNKEDRLNLLLSGRVIQRHFDRRPVIASGKYFYRYHDLEAVLGSVSLFRQTFYKTNFIYGFGRNEDVPEGLEASLIAGYTKTAGRQRPYIGVDLQRYYFSRSDHYFNFTLRAGSYFSRLSMEDVGLLGGVDYFSKLQQLGERWKGRTFISASATRQLNYRLSEPLFLESVYGLQRYRNDNRGGDSRLSIKAESVFFSPWTVVYFRLAPFGFGAASLFRTPEAESRKAVLYSAVGGGLRIQNESLVFGTIEVKGAYFPRSDFDGRRWRIDFGTNIRFRYNREFIKRPELVGLN